MQSVGAALDNTDLVVQAFHEAKGDLVLRFAVGGDTVPVALNHRGELLEGLQTLPLQLRTPALEEFPRPSLGVVVPQLTERFLEHIRGVQALVGPEQKLEVLARRAFEI